MVRFLHHLQQLEQVKSVEAHTLMVNFLRSDMVTIIINLKQVKEQTKKRRSLVRAAEEHCGTMILERPRPFQPNKIWSEY